MARSRTAGRAPGNSARKPPAPPSGTRRRAWRAGVRIGAAFVLGCATASVVMVLVTGPDATERQITELQQAEVDRDVAQIGSLTRLARGSSDRLTPVLLGMAKVAPVGKATQGPPLPLTADEVKSWRNTLSAEVAQHADSPSAGNGVNVARIGLRTAVQQLAAAVDGFEAALTATGPQRQRLITLAGQQRTLALRNWSGAAVQLDVINIEAGNGHVHVQLSAGPDSGVVAPDSSPEGSRRP